MTSRTTNTKRVAALVASTFMLAPLVTQAATVDESYYYPDLSSLFQDLGTETLPASFSLFNGNVDTSVTDTSVEFTNRSGCTPCTFIPAAFNGFVLTYTGLPITSVTLDPTSDIPGFTAADFSFTSNTITVNFQGLEQYNPEFVLLDVNSAIPEPAAWTLMLVGMGGLGWASRSRRRRPLAQAAV